MEPEQEQKPKNKMKLNKTWIMVAILVGITGILLIVSLSSKIIFKEPAKPFVEKENIVKSTLLVSNEIRPSTKSGTFEVDVVAGPKGNKITVAQLEMNYDPNILRNVDIKPGNFFSNPTILAKKVDSKNGTIKFWVANPANQPGVTESGTVAVITFSKTGNAKTPLNFLPKTALSASGTDRSVLEEMVSGIVGTLPSSVNLSPAPKDIQAEQ
jgi:hypothetical protein